MLTTRWDQDKDFPCVWNLKFILSPPILEGCDRRIRAWVEKRPHYCDRGHYVAKIEGIYDLDEQDGFPRYYMRLETAKQEVEDFLNWRLFQVRAEPY